MEVERIAKALDLEAARIVAKASATEDYALILMERAAEDHAAAEAWRVRAASAQAIAGSLWMLVRPQEAFAPLGHAEDIHHTMGSAYGSLLSICAHPRRPAPAQPLPHDAWGGPQTVSLGDSERERSPNPDHVFARLQPAASLLAHLWPLAVGQTDQDLSQLLSDAPLLEALPGSWLTGRLRIPLGHYRGLATEIDRLRHDRSAHEHPHGNPLPAASAFLERATEAIAAARENAHQWRTLRSPILPAEPEVIAACALVEMTVRDAFGASAIDVMDVPTDSLGGALMGVAQNLLDADASTTPHAAL